MDRRAARRAHRRESGRYAARGARRPRSRRGDHARARQRPRLLRHRPARADERGRPGCHGPHPGRQPRELSPAAGRRSEGAGAVSRAHGARAGTRRAHRRRARLAQRGAHRPRPGAALPRPGIAAVGGARVGRGRARGAALRAAPDGRGGHHALPGRYPGAPVRPARLAVRGAGNRRVHPGLPRRLWRAGHARALARVVLHRAPAAARSLARRARRGDRLRAPPGIHAAAAAAAAQRVRRCACCGASSRPPSP